MSIETNDEKERDAAIEAFTNAGFRERAIDLWNASRSTGRLR